MTTNSSTPISAGDIFPHFPNLSNLHGIPGPMGPQGPCGQNAVLVTDGEIVCKSLKVNDINMKVLMEQLATMIPIFIPPEDIVMNTPAVKEAYKQYMDARARLVVTRDQLDFLIKLSKQTSST